MVSGRLKGQNLKFKFGLKFKFDLVSFAIASQRPAFAPEAGSFLFEVLV